MMAQYLVQQQLQFVADCERRYADKLLRTISKLHASKSSNVELLPSAAEMTQPPPVVEELPKAGADKQGTETALEKSSPPRDVQEQASSDFIPEKPTSGQQQEVKDMTESKSEPKPEELTTARRSSSRESSATEPRDVHQQASSDFIPEEPTSGQQQEVKDMTKASSEPKPEDLATARRSSSREFSATEPGDEEEVNEAKEAERDEEAPIDENVVEEEQYEEQATEKVQSDEQQLEEEDSSEETISSSSEEYFPDEDDDASDSSSTSSFLDPDEEDLIFVETKPSKQDNNLKTAISSASPQKQSSLQPGAAKAMELDVEEEEDDEERVEPDDHGKRHRTPTSMDDDEQPVKSAKVQDIHVGSATSEQSASAAVVKSSKEHPNQAGPQQVEAVIRGGVELVANGKPPQPVQIPKELENYGNTCFYNSTIQCLLNTAPLGLYLDAVMRPRSFWILENYRAKLGDRIVEVEANAFEFNEATEQMAMFWALKKFHEDYKSPGNRSANPSPLFQQICKKVPRFRGFHQQDAHELLQKLLENVRQDEINRFDIAFDVSYIVQGKLQPSPDQKQFLCEALLEGPARPTLDAVFGGQLQRTTHCTRCKQTSVCIEPFFDIPLAIATTPNNSTSTAQTQSSGKLTAEQCTSGDLHKLRRKERKERKRQKKARKAEAKKNKQQQKRQKSANLGPASANGKEANKSGGNEEAEENHDEEALAEADSVPTLSVANILELFTTPPTDTEENGLENMEETRPESDPPNGHEQNEEEAVEKHEEQPLVNGGTREEEPSWEQEEARSGVHALASGSRVEGEKTVVGALGAFTSAEMLRPGPNGYSCGKCAEEAKKRGEKQPPPQAMAIKRALILTPPLILTLHLNRFEKTANSMKKSNVFVGFDPLLDLGPFSRDKCKRIQPGQQHLLYSLYGIVTHDGNIRGGHYIAYVRCRPPMNPKRLEEFFKEANAHDGNQTPTEEAELLEQKLRELKLTNGLETEENGAKKTEPGLEALLQQHADNLAQSEWYRCSDTVVRRVDEKVVMKAQAFLLFYERIF